MIILQTLLCYLLDNTFEKEFLEQVVTKHKANISFTKYLNW